MVPFIDTGIYLLTACRPGFEKGVLFYPLFNACLEGNLLNYLRMHGTPDVQIFIFI
jgi:hypothetical protein